MKEKQSRVIEVLTVFLLVVSVIMIYVVNSKIPFMMDDLWYSTKLSSETPISSFADIVESQVWHYNNWGGRSMAHGLLQMILLCGESFADVLNVVVTFVLAGIICRVSGNRKLPMLLGAVGMLLGLNANWKMSMFWQSGAANYLYITIFVLLFLSCYLREAEGVTADLPGITLWMIPLGLVTGWSNENMGPAVWVISAIVIGLRAKDKQGVKLWMLLGNLTCLIGSVLMIAAPGNFVRSNDAAANGYGVLWNCFLRCYAESKAAMEFLFPTLLILGFLLFISKGVLQIPIGRQNSLLMLCALLSWGAMILSPHYPDRATFGTMVLLICTILSLAREIAKRRVDAIPWLFGGAVLVWLRGMFCLGEYLAICWGWIV